MDSREAVETVCEQQMKNFEILRSFVVRLDELSHWAVIAIGMGSEPTCRGEPFTWFACSFHFHSHSGGKPRSVARLDQDLLLDGFSWFGTLASYLLQNQGKQVLVVLLFFSSLIEL